MIYIYKNKVKGFGDGRIKEYWEGSWIWKIYSHALLVPFVVVDRSRSRSQNIIPKTLIFVRENPTKLRDREKKGCEKLIWERRECYAIYNKNANKKGRIKRRHIYIWEIKCPYEVPIEHVQLSWLILTQSYHYYYYCYLHINNIYIYIFCFQAYESKHYHFNYHQSIGWK